MKHLIICLIVLCGLFATSCRGPENKSVVEPLTPKEVNGLIKKDKAWAATIYSVESRQKKMSRAEHKLFQDLTYKDYFDYNKEVFEKAPQWTDEAEKQWNDKNARTIARIDSVYDYWVKWEKENRLESIVKCIPIKFYINEDGKECLQFKITASKGSIASTQILCYSKYSHKSLFTMDIGGSAFVNVRAYDFNELTVESKPFSYDKDLIIDNELPLRNLSEDIQNLGVRQVVDKYGIRIFPHRVEWVADENFTVWNTSHLDKIPKPIRKLFNGKEVEPLTSFEYHVIASDILGIEDFQTLSSYTSDYIRGKENQLNDLAYRFDHPSYRF